MTEWRTNTTFYITAHYQHLYTVLKIASCQRRVFQVAYFIIPLSFGTHHFPHTLNYLELEEDWYGPCLKCGDSKRYVKIWKCNQLLVPVDLFIVRTNTLALVI